jgi:hypothetical protein
MAIARCEKHPFERDTKERYDVFALPLGFPETAAICGRAGCDNAAHIWLSPEEIRQHGGGERFFGLNDTRAIRVRVEGGLNTN